MSNNIEKSYNLDNSGYITLISVLVVGAVGMAIVISLIQFGLGSSRTSFALEQSSQAKSLVDACVEEALEQIRNSTPFIGNGNLSFDLGDCDYTVTNDGGQNRTVTSSGTVDSIIRKNKVIISTINPQIIITSWQEVGDF